MPGESTEVSSFFAIEQSRQSLFQPTGKPSLTFPDCDHPPSFAPQCVSDRLVPANVTFEFAHPERGSCFGEICEFAALMTMPEATVNEKNCLVAGEHQIRVARKISTVKPKTQAQAVQKRPDGDLRFCVLSSYPRHVPTASRWSEIVDHYPTAPISIRKSQMLSAIL
jgi:hypothetical protein